MKTGSVLALVLGSALALHAQSALEKLAACERWGKAAAELTDAESNQLAQIGSLAPGKRADLVLVDRDVLTVPVAELGEAKVLWTMFGGKVVYGSGP